MKKILIGFKCRNPFCNYLITKALREMACYDFSCPQCDKDRISKFTPVYEEGVQKVQGRNDDTKK